MQPESNSSLKKIIAIALVIAVMLVAVYFFFFRSTAPVITLDQFGNPVQAQVVGQDLIDLLNQLQGVTFDDSLFHDPAFVSLTDFAVTLPVLPQGRANPFDTFPGQSLSAPAGQGGR